jgi:hypothetical protein
MKFSGESKCHNPSGATNDENVFNQLKDHLLKMEPFTFWDHGIDSSHEIGCNLVNYTPLNENKQEIGKEVQACGHGLFKVYLQNLTEETE